MKAKETKKKATRAKTTEEKHSKKHGRFRKWFGIICLILVCGLGAFFLLNPQHFLQQKEEKTIGDIRAPWGYTKVECKEGTMGAWLRELPLKKPGTPIKLYTGGLARMQWLGYAVVDVPLLSNNEQCADVCMRLRGEYLYSQGKYAQIQFTSLGGKKMAYGGGISRKAFEKYMREVFGSCNTKSLYQSLEQRNPEDIQPGDVLVYPARKGRKYGHAIIVVDVAKNKKGDIMIMCAEGNTPARDMHIVRNKRGAWVKLSTKGDNHVGPFRFEQDNLRKW